MFVTIARRKPWTLLLATPALFPCVPKYYWTTEGRNPPILLSAFLETSKTVADTWWYCILTIDHCALKMEAGSKGVKNAAVVKLIWRTLSNHQTFIKRDERSISGFYFHIVSVMTSKNQDYGRLESQSNLDKLLKVILHLFCCLNNFLVRKLLWSSKYHYGNVLKSI